MQPTTTQEATNMDTATYYVSWEHEYFTDDDATTCDTLAEAQELARQLAARGKRRIRIDGPGLDPDADEDIL